MLEQWIKENAKIRENGKIAVLKPLMTKVTRFPSI